MAKDNANNFVLLKEDSPESGTYTQVAYIKTNDLARAKALIDVTNKTDGAERCLIPGGQGTLDISCEGVASDHASLGQLWDLLESATQGARFRVEHRSIDGTQTRRRWEAFFCIANMDHSGAINEELGFTCQLQSSGPIVITPNPS